MRQEESVPAPRGWTGGAAWKGAGASLLLHLFVGAAMVVALSGPPKAAPRVIDLTLLPPAELTRARSRPPSPRRKRREIPGRPSGRNRPPFPLATRRESARWDRAGGPARPGGGRERSRLRIPASPGYGIAHDRARVPRGSPGSPPGHRGRGTTLGTSPGSATPSSTRSPTRRQRAGWGGKGRSLSLSSFSRTVRYGTCGSCRARGTPPWTGERSTRSETPPRSPAPRWKRRSSPPSSIG